MLRLTVHPDQKSLTRTAREFQAAANALPHIRGQAIRATTRHIQRESIRLVAKDLRVKQSDIKKRGAVRYRFTMGRGGPTGSVTTISARRLSARFFKPIQRKKGVSLRIGDGREIKPGTFLARLNYRTAGGTGGTTQAVGIRERASRVPIAMLHGPSPGRVAGKSPRLREIVEREAPKRLTEDVTRTLRRHIDLQRARAAGVV